jgi:hypothetical protein
MAKKLDNTSIRMGYLIRVANEGRKPSEAQMYYALKLEDRRDNEFWCLLTSKEVLKLTQVQIDDGVQAHKPGHLYYRHRVGKTWRSFCFVVLPNPDHESSNPGPTMCVMLTDSKLIKWRKRAERNNEDIPGMSWVKDLMD